MNIRPIKNEQDYEEALQALKELVQLDPAPDSQDGDKLSILSTLIEKYEANRYPRTLPSPLDAIQFRMEQANLKPADLIPYIGSRSKVSEVLSGKRTLSLEMIRALEAGLGIPADVLIQKPEATSESFQSWSEPLVREMDKRGYFGDENYTGKNKESLLAKFFGNNLTTTQLAWRKTSPRLSVRTDSYALLAWAEHIKHQAAQIEAPTSYKDGTINAEFMQKVIQFSSKDDGPLLVQDFLKAHGIILVVSSHLPKTRVDGVAILENKERPIIGLSLRFDRVDNFWFTLLHELAHIALHLNDNSESIIFDELEDAKGVDVSEKETEADELAQESIIPSSKWEISPAKITPSVMAAEDLASELGINPAVVAGYIRHKNQNYFYLKNLINNNKTAVRHLFATQWNG